MTQQQQQQQYHRVRQTNRQIEDYHRNILVYLERVGPSSISELTFKLETSHAMIKRALIPLIANELVRRQTFQELGINRPTGGRRKLLPLGDPIPAGGHRNVRRLSNHIQVLLVITEAGRELLKKQNKLQRFMKWKDSDK